MAPQPPKNAPVRSPPVVAGYRGGMIEGMQGSSARAGWLRFRGLGTAAVAVALFSASSVLSQPSAGSWGPVAERVRELEARVARLELRLIDAERLLESRAAPAAVKAFPSAMDLGYESCDPPTVVDPFGTRLLKAGCERHVQGDPCQPALVVDRAGVRSPRPGCEHLVTGTVCDPPFVTDPSGARIVRRECLDVGY